MLVKFHYIPILNSAEKEKKKKQRRLNKNKNKNKNKKNKQTNKKKRVEKKEKVIIFKYQNRNQCRIVLLCVHSPLYRIYSNYYNLTEKNSIRHLDQN